MTGKTILYLYVCKSDGNSPENAKYTNMSSFISYFSIFLVFSFSVECEIFLFFFMKIEKRVYLLYANVKYIYSC